jgi:hypothetical protein
VISGISGVADEAGNALAVDEVWSFTTVALGGDTTPPTVTGVGPTDGATDVAVNTVVTATFDEAMDVATIDETTVELRDGGGTLVAATVAYDGPSQTATLTPSAPLANSEPYTATVRGEASGVTDVAGNALAADFNWSFATEAPDPTGCPCSLWDETVTPTLIQDPDTSAVELGLKFQSNSDGQVLGVRFYKGSGNIGTHVGSLWDSAGQRLAQVTFTNESASGWQESLFAAPVSITADTTYIVSYHTDVGRYSVDENYFTGSGYSNGPLSALADGEEGGNGVYQYGVSAFPSNTFRAGNYWVDVLFVPTGGGTP